MHPTIVRAYELLADRDDLAADMERRRQEIENDFLKFDDFVRGELAGASTVPQNNEASVIRRTLDTSAPAAAPPSNSGTLTADMVVEAVAQALAVERARERSERESAIAPLRERILVLESKRDVALALLTGTSKTGADISTLPGKRVAHVA